MDKSDRRRQSASPEVNAARAAKMHAHWANPENHKRHGEAVSKTSRAAWKDPEQRAKKIAGLKKMHQDPDYLAKLAAARASPLYRAKRSELALASWADPVAREKRVAAMQDVSETRRRRLLAGAEAAWLDPEKRAARIAKGRATREANRLNKL